jgi:5-(carboxyamino)imidazole ribonucleotide synthase
MMLGVLGGGQLGRMMALAAARLGVRTRCFDPDPDACAGDVCELHTAAWNDADAIARFATGCDAVTFEFENVPAQTLSNAMHASPVFPPLAALETGQDRLLEKQLFELAGLHVHAYESIERESDIDRALAKIGVPCVVKTRRGGYDGKGQCVLRSVDDARGLWHRLGGVPLLMETFVPFERELSLIAVRSRAGEFAAYPLAQNRHERGMLRESIAPAPQVDAAIASEAQRHMHELMNRLSYVGVLAIEFFVAKQSGRTVLLANEMAPRVHNSGHWTMDAGITCQFENHVRAVLGLPLGDTTLRGNVAMVNLIGNNPKRSEVLAINGARLHLYNKESRENRKIGHVNIAGDSLANLQPRIDALKTIAARCDAR